MTTVSVCIVTYNSAGDIASCLDAVLQQTHPVSAIVIVDNASSDQSVELIKGFIRRGSPIELIENSVNNGFAGGQNQAIKATDTDYVLVLNPDVIMKPNYIADIVNKLEQEPLAGSATGQLLSKEKPELIDSTGLQMGMNRHAVDRGAGEPAANWNDSGEVFGVSGAAAVYARRMIRDIMLNGEFFDEHFFAYKEDVDVAWRARLLGWSSFYVPSAKAYHARGWKKEGRRSISLFVRQHSYMNQWFMIVKNERPGWHLLKLLPMLAFREAAKFVYILLRERDLLRCLPALLRTMPVMLRKRKMLAAKLREKHHAKV